MSLDMQCIDQHRDLGGDAGKGLYHTREKSRRDSRKEGIDAASKEGASKGKEV